MSDRSPLDEWYDADETAAPAPPRREVAPPAAGTSLFEFNAKNILFVLVPLTLAWGALATFSAFPALFLAAMCFDAPRPGAGTYLMAGAILSVPVVSAGCAVFMWIAYAVRHYRKAFWIALLPLIEAAVFLVLVGI